MNVLSTESSKQMPHNFKYYTGSWDYNLTKTQIGYMTLQNLEITCIIIDLHNDIEPR